MKNGHSKLLGWKKFEESKLFQPILWDTFLNKKRVDLHTQALNFFGAHTILWLNVISVTWWLCEVHVCNTEFQTLSFAWELYILKWKQITFLLFFLVLLTLDPCSSLSPPCFTEEDRFSLEALRMIHKQMDDDKDGGIEVDESDEVGVKKNFTCAYMKSFLAFCFVQLLFIFQHLSSCCCSF